MNGANPFVGSENLSHNIDHFYNVTEYSLEQILTLAAFVTSASSRSSSTSSGRILSTTLGSP